MKKSNYLEAGDRIYLIDDYYSDDYRIIEITLIEEQIENRSIIEPTFVYGNLRLKNARALENDEVELEQGDFYDSSIGMHIDYGYCFYDSDVKCFATREAAQRYIDSETTKLEILEPHYEATMRAVDEHLNELKDLIRGHERFVKDHKIPKQVARQLDYETLDELSEFFFGLEMFE